MRFGVTIFIVLGLLAAACVKKERICCALPPVEMIRTQTQCADEWGYGSTNDATLVKMQAFLAAKGISLERSSLVPTGDSVNCKACTCSSGYYFDIWANARYIDTLRHLGFTIR